VRAAVIGAGIMGTGVAQVLAQAGFEVALGARSRESLDAALERIAHSQRDLVSAGLLTEPEARASLARVRPSQDLAEAVQNADFVSENIPEDLGLKLSLFQRLSRLAKPTAILSTNTSGLPITAIASTAHGPERVVGFHWLNPPHLTVAVEITRGAKTSETTMQAAVALALRLGRRPLRVERDTPGFLWNRLQMALFREALDIVEQGIATPETVDQAIQLGLGLRWAALGPFRIADLAGLATFRAVAAHVYPALSTAGSPQPRLEDLIRGGRTGARAGQGFYAYPPGAHEALIRERDARLIALRRMLLQGEA
jgi:3-hydroxybutyryl-CoA dehydrogenase